jgi:hypothetical protein
MTSHQQEIADILSQNNGQSQKQVDFQLETKPSAVKELSSQLVHKHYSQHGGLNSQVPHPGDAKAQPSQSQY